MTPFSHRSGFLFGQLSSAALSVWFLAQVSTISNGQVKVFLVDWVPRLDVELAFRLDGLSLLFCFLQWYLRAGFRR